MQLVYWTYIDLAVPISPPAIGGYQYVAKYTDHYGRWHEIFPIKNKPDAADTLNLFGQSLCLSATESNVFDSIKGGEYTGKAFQAGLQRRCYMAGVVQYEFISTKRYIGTRRTYHHHYGEVHHDCR